MGFYSYKLEQGCESLRHTGGGGGNAYLTNNYSVRVRVKVRYYTPTVSCL